MKLRKDLEEKRERWGGARRVAVDEEDEFDAMFEEEMGGNEKQEIGTRAEEQQEAPKPPPNMIGVENVDTSDSA